MQYYAKAAYAGLTVFLGSLLAGLQAGEGVEISELGTAAWVTIVLATVVAIGGVLGLQSASANISTSVR